MSNENNLNDFFENELAREYVEFASRILKNSASCISMECENLMNSEVAQENEVISDSVNRIFTRCCRIMQLPVYYEMMRSMFFSEKGQRENTKMSFLAEKFQMNVEESLGNTCKVTVSHYDMCTMSVPEDFLIFILIAFVRHTVIEGAKAIDVRFHCISEYASDNLLQPPERYAVILLEASEFGAVNRELSNDFVYEHFGDMLKLFKEKYGVEYELSKEVLKLKLPVSSEDEELFAHSERRNIDQSDFYTFYNVYLRELNPDAYI